MMAPPARRALALVALSAVAALCISLLSQPAAPSPSDLAPVARSGDGRPNIVLVMTDDMRVDELRFMPHVRRYFRRHGVRMENSFSSNPLCCPARASFLTGQHSSNHGVLSHVPPYGFGAFDDSTTIATALRGSGYRTGFIGKYLNGYGTDASKVTGRSSRTYVPRGWSQWMPAVDGRGAWGSHFYMASDLNVNGRVASYPNEYKTSLYGRLARGMIDRFTAGPRRTPFFLYLSHLAPHHGLPRDPDDIPDTATPYRPAHVRGLMTDRITKAAGTPGFGQDSEPDISDKPRFMRNPKMTRADHVKMRSAARQRAESLVVVDREFARMLARLKKRGQFRNTVVMFTSDNGYFQGEHRRTNGKIHAYEPVLRVPLLIGGAGIPNGRKRFDPITTIDVTATILDLADASRRLPRTDGVSVLPSIRRGDRGWSRPVVYQGGLRKRDDAWFGAQKLGALGIRTARYKYVRHVGGFEELYDLRRDPLELRNRARVPRHRETLREMRGLTKSLQGCSGAGCNPSLSERFAVGPRAAARLHRIQKRAEVARYGE